MSFPLEYWTLNSYTEILVHKQFFLIMPLIKSYITDASLNTFFCSSNLPINEFTKRQSKAVTKWSCRWGWRDPFRHNRRWRSKAQYFGTRSGFKVRILLSKVTRGRWGHEVTGECHLVAMETLITGATLLTAIEMSYVKLNIAILSNLFDNLH